MVKKRTKKKPQRDGLVKLDPEKLDRLRLRNGWSKAMLANQADLGRRTVVSIFQGKGVFASSANLIATAFGVSVEDLMPHKNDIETPNRVYALPKTEEWEPLDYLGGWKTASNGLQYRICRMRHRHIEDRYGRGKFYDLLEVPTDNRTRMKEMLTRHTKTSSRIGSHPHVTTTLSTIPIFNEEGWWVIDRWYGKTTLAKRLLDGPYSSEGLPRLMYEIALGLEAMHTAKIVFRELAPGRVLIAQDNGRAILSEFELAKLLDSTPTVSNDWPQDSYRAEEVESGNFDEKADFYSWARILLQAASGELPPRGHEFDVLTRLGLPKNVWRLASDCLSPLASERPKNIQTILKALKSWSGI